MDLLIGTSALVDGARIISRNARDFERVPGLEIISYLGGYDGRLTAVCPARYTSRSRPPPATRYPNPAAA